MSEKHEKPHGSVLKMGPGTYEVPIKLFSYNRERLVSELLRNSKTPRNSIVLLQGGDNINIYSSDVSYTFRQESYFMWAFGVLDPGCFGAINLQTDKSCLFIPRPSEESEIFLGSTQTLENFKNKYGVHFVHYIDEIPNFFKTMLGDSGVLLLMQGINTDSGLEIKPAYFQGIEDFDVNYEVLFPTITELRVFKTDFEQNVIRYVVEISAEAHKLVMRTIKPGYSEYQAESLFLDYCYRLGGCRFMSYTCICGTGANSAVLNYGHAGAPNSRIINNGDMCLFDMGANYFGYSADITCSFPVNGKFTHDQKLIYNAVLAANQAIHKAAKPGVSWVGMHILASRTLLMELKKAGLIKGNIDAMLSAGLHYIFQPHGLGHLIGLDVHDVGGYAPELPPRPTALGVDKLRFARILQPRMYITIEPGCYFIKPLLNRAKYDPELRKFLILEVIERFMDFGGVRIEDNVFVTENGVENITFVPRTVEEIEEWMARKK